MRCGPGNGCVFPEANPGPDAVPAQQAYTNVLTDLAYRKVGTDHRAVRSGVAGDLFWSHQHDGALSVSSKALATEDGHKPKFRSWIRSLSSRSLAQSSQSIVYGIDRKVGVFPPMGE